MRGLLQLAPADAQSAAHSAELAGLPETWKRDPGDDYAAGKFSLGGKLPKVRENVWLWPGLFNDTLPVVLNLTRAMGTGDFNVSFLHIDCDLYQGKLLTECALAHSQCADCARCMQVLRRPCSCSLPISQSARSCETSPQLDSCPSLA